MNTVDSRVCTVCGQPATAPDVKYMEPRCLEHAHVLRPPDTGRRMFWRLGEDERLRRGLGLPVPNARQAKTLASEDAKLAGTGVSRADYGALELRVLVSVMSHLTNEVVREMSQTTAMDEATARAMVEATIRTFASNGPLRAEELRYQPPLMTAAEVNALPPKAREYIHQLVANTDPAGMVRENMQLLDTNKGLQSMYRSAADDRDRMREVLERVKTGMEWTRDGVPAEQGWSRADDEMLAEIDKVLTGGEPTPQQKHIGYMVCADGRYMYWPVEGLQEARTYCEDNVEPVKLMADVAELNKHEEGQV